MDTRSRHEAQIKNISNSGTLVGREFEGALTEIAFKHGLSWFTDDQIAEIRDVIIKTQWDRRRRTREMMARNLAARRSRMGVDHA